jgi:hypothetical protein
LLLCWSVVEKIVSSHIIVVTDINIMEDSIYRTNISEQTKKGVEIDSKPRCG